MSDLARRSPVDHRPLIRDAKDFSERQPSFAADCALLALHWISAGRAFEVSTGDVMAAFDHLLEAGRRGQFLELARSRLQDMLDPLPAENMVLRVLNDKLEGPTTG